MQTSKNGILWEMQKVETDKLRHDVVTKIIGKFTITNENTTHDYFKHSPIEYGRKPKKVKESLQIKQQKLEEEHLLRKVKIDYGNSKKD